MTSPQLRSAHARQRDSTRNAILDTAMRMVHDDPASQVTHEAIADRSGIAARTVYRHFPTRGHLGGALWARMRDETGTRWPTTEADIAPSVRAQFAQFEQHETFVRASIVTPAMAHYQAHGSAEGRAAFQQSLATVTRDLSPAESRRLVAVCVAMYSAPFWQMLRDRGKLSAEEAREAAAMAFEAVISAAKARARVRKRKPTLHKENRP
ncbi:MAG: TetR/AcrR family transcriptional regulator [Gemmatimonadaceae bacterium]